MKFITLILTSIVLTACGGSSGGGEPLEKDLFSLWTDSSDGSSMDLTGGSTGSSFTFNIYASDGSQCDCKLRFLGTEDSGSYVLNNCYYDYGSSANGDPGCDSLNHSGTYTKSMTTLEICDDEQDCTKYR